MADEAKSEYIKMANVDLPPEPPHEDVKANEAAKQGAMVDEENGADFSKHNGREEENGAHLLKQNHPGIEETLDINHMGESLSPKKGDNLEAKDEGGDSNDHIGREENSSSITIEKGDSSKSNQPESDPFSDLNENENKALEEFRSKVEEAILTNKLLKKKKQHEQKEASDEKVKSKEGECKKSEVEDQQEKRSEEDEGMVDKGKAKVVDEEYDDKKGNIDNGEACCLWGVPLMPSGGDKGTDVVLLKFLRARDFKVNDALEMLSSTLQWRKENNIDSILEENVATDYDSMATINGVDRKGHPICYNVYGVFGNEDLYNKTFGTQESREKFLRWRLQLMERQIQALDFRRPELGKSSLLQINDLKDTPGPSRKDLRVATRQAVALLQDNYPEFVARNIFINVPFWYYAFNALLSPFLTQRTKSKFVFARANRVTETLCKYIAGEEIPVKYGGLKRENDPDFSSDDGVSEITVKAGSAEVIEIPAPQVGSTLIWDLTVIGWEVNYKEEFVPSAESSYTLIVKKDRRIGWQEGSVRNSFRNSEPGKIVLNIENGQFKRKRVLYRFKAKAV